MPNHITNRIVSSDLPKIKAALYGGEGRDVDFNMLVPMPQTVKDAGNPPITLGGEMPDWYTWSIEHWGTKWNAYDVDVTDKCIQFDTAWSCPEPIVKALTKLGVPFTWEYADEDIGSNLGTWQFRGAGQQLTFTEFPEEDRDREACRIKGYDWDEYQADIAEWEEGE